ncbi:hypothetical protein AN958_00015 [Leucoagaricus sp. SymC.cos]|nr:hypothetical protein AN958_00015 [Leucoagaricus sp. SymC.cos]
MQVEVGVIEVRDKSTGDRFRLQGMAGTDVLNALYNNLRRKLRPEQFEVGKKIDKCGISWV